MYTVTRPAIKKEKETLPFVTRWMHPEGVLLSEVSQRKY